MSLNQKKSQGIIYPSIDGLVGMIQAAKNDPADEETARLREMCRHKLRAYKVDEYLKRYTTTEEQVAARARWELVHEFAHPQGRG
ncbi:MAG: hypothetical protein H0V44_17425 [Planctomycetes bacterium]|nr:hypothetical protein [Planctomycetota bacterium]